MRFTVTWLPSADAELAQIWIDSSDRKLVTLAAKEIERQLSNDPLNIGESRGGNERIVIERPLGVLVEVLEDDRLAKVLHVWRITAH